ncbi:unnamed protein product [Rotaria socialis]|uniref:Exostosin GT47 domain-containing protein n=1 Tax=Rotaria socialis TaxID=392032 RepID=A0A817MCC4_9BILA|nr:unnamed protein product [Rotaria socialis]CAF4130988.1 unnamed protein product [Rotaria socialis]
MPKNETTIYDLLYNRTNPINQVSVYYRQATSARNSSYPYISGDAFRAFADYVYDETRQDKLSLVKYGEIIFVKTDSLLNFFKSPFDSIKEPFVLVTHNSDASAPAIYESYLLNPKILIWYASNPSVRNRAKLSPIPIGLANAYWPHGNLRKFTFALRNHRKPWSQRTNLLYVNFEVANNKAQRAKALLQASKIGNVKVIKQRITLETYLEQLGNVKFVLSPPGGGTDCHRTWETLYMGAVPIVLSSGLDPLFSKTRSVIVNDWSQLTQDFLLSFNFSLNDRIIPNVLKARYWRETLFRHRHNYSLVSP